jgi:hypothetical protein
MPRYRHPTYGARQLMDKGAINRLTGLPVPDADRTAKGAQADASEFTELLVAGLFELIVEDGYGLEHDLDGNAKETVAQVIY